MPTIAGRQKPIEKFAAAVSKCSAEATAYGKCVVADYEATHQDMCAREFGLLKDCYLGDEIFSEYDKKKEEAWRRCVYGVGKGELWFDISPLS